MPKVKKEKMKELPKSDIVTKGLGPMHLQKPSIFTIIPVFPK